jgi:hypothetical protein
MGGGRRELCRASRPQAMPRQYLGGRPPANLLGAFKNRLDGSRKTFDQVSGTT